MRTRQKVPWLHMVVLVTILGLAGTALSDLAQSPWPTLHGNSRLSQAADLNGDGTPGPDGPNDRSGIEVVQKWSKTGLGACVGNVSIGTDGSLYYANDGKLRKIDPDDGDDLATPYPFPNDVETPNQPMVTRESGADKIYVGVEGELYKFNTSLGVETNWPIDVVDTDQNPDQILLPTGGLVHSTQSDAVIFVGQGPWLNNGPSGTVLFAVSPSNGAILSEFNVGAEIIQVIGASDSDFDEPDEIAVINTPSIGPDPDSAGDELVYVLTLDHLLAVEFDTGSRTFASDWKWITQITPPQSGSSPSVSPDGSRVYVTTGRDLIPFPPVNSRLESYNTSDGSLEAYTVEMPGKVIASLVVDYDADRGGNMIYANVWNGPIYGFFETIGTGGGSDSFKCRWKTDADYESTGANMGKAGKMLYSPFRITGDGTLQGYAGGFDTSSAHLDCNGSLGCFAGTCSGATPNWQISMGTLALDGCTRSLGYEGGKAQVYFGTASKLFSFEESEL